MKKRKLLAYAVSPMLAGAGGPQRKVTPASEQEMQSEEFKAFKHTCHTVLAGVVLMLVTLTLGIGVGTVKQIVYSPEPELPAVAIWTPSDITILVELNRRMHVRSVTYDVRHPLNSVVVQNQDLMRQVLIQQQSRSSYYDHRDYVADPYGNMRYRRGGRRVVVPPYDSYAQLNYLREINRQRYQRLQVIEAQQGRSGGGDR